jgi:RNA polymerase sigma-54 factor
VRRADRSEEQQTLKNHLQEARFFLNSLHSRNETLLRVARCIVEEQRAFLDYGPEAMKPLILRDISERLGVHESTVSRATAHKYMHTPRGLFELKYFFSSHVGTTSGGTASATAIQAMIKRLIAEEKPNKPLSDSHLAKLLLDSEVKVARRTVAKYREAMGIPPSHERKQPA